MKQAGLIKLDITLSIFISLMIIGVFWWFRNQEGINQRDAQRLADLRQIQVAFELLYRDEATYLGASCQSGDLVSQCDLGAYLPEIKNIKDPGQFKYQISVTPSQKSYAVTFTLEKNYSDLIKGEHSLSEQGIQ